MIPMKTMIRFLTLALLLALMIPAAFAADPPADRNSEAQSGDDALNTGAATEQPVAAPSVMRQEPLNYDEIINGTGCVLGNSAVLHADISRIEFSCHPEAAPDDAWDASEAGDGSVLAWVSDSPDGKLLTIAGRGGVAIPGNTPYLFSGYINAKEIRFNGQFSTSNLTKMTGMFAGCSNLQRLDLSGIDTRNVTDMTMMFIGCDSLQSLDLSGFDTGNVTDMGWMFSKCAGLKSLDLSGFDTGNVEIMKEMFSGCAGLQSLDLSGFDTGNVMNMYYMFCGCAGLKSLDLSGFDTGNVKYMGCMFYWCDRLQGLDLSGFDTGRVCDASFMFQFCKSLETIAVSSDFVLMESSVASPDLFEGCPAIILLNGEPMSSGDWLKQAAVVPEEITSGNTGQSVRWLQNSLIKLGYDPGTVDGNFGPRTQDALKSFQKDADLNPTGQADDETLRALREWLLR